MFPEGQGVLPSMTGCAVTVPACFTLWPSQHTQWHLLLFLLPVMLCPLIPFNYVNINPQGTSFWKDSLVCPAWACTPGTSSRFLVPIP